MNIDRDLQRRSSEVKRTVQEFREHLERSSLKEGTINNYVFDVQYFLEWYENNRTRKSEPLVLRNAVTSYEIERYLSHLKSEYAEETINRKISSLNRFGEWAVSERQLESYKRVMKIKSHKEDDEEIEYLNASQRRTLERSLREEQDLRELVMYRVIIMAAASPEELRKIKIGDVDIPGGVLKVGTGKKERRVFMTEEDALMLGRYTESECPERTPEDYLFQGRTRNKPIATTLIYRVFKKQSEKVGFKVTPFIIKCTAVFLMFKNKIPFVTIHQYTGGGSAASTLRYRHFYDTITDL